VRAAHAEETAMHARSALFLLALPLALAAAEPPTPAASAAPEMAASSHVMYDADALKWGPAPDALPPGAQVAVLFGDPGKAGRFVMRLKAPAGYKVPRHWHPTDEVVTVLEGDFSLDMGDGTSAHSHTFSPGGFVVLPAKMLHAGSSTGGAVLQVAGMGPFQINYVDPKDDPRQAKKP
jgi:anti-sigma factor ChrR (cupin superfamily)